MYRDFITTLKTRLQAPLPGIDVQFEMANRSRKMLRYDELDRSGYRQSAVLILIFPNNREEPSILLIQRVTYNGHHSGQIALPGGKAEEADQSLEHTALREFFEETGSSLQPTVLGKLTPIYIPVSAFVVHPYVAYVTERPAFTPSPDEVAQLLEFDVADLTDPGHVKETVIELAENMKIKTPYFDVQGKVLWGATAMILNELKYLVR